MRGKQFRQGVTLGALILVAFWLISLIWGLIDKAQLAIGEARSAELQYQTIEDRRTDLEASIAALDTPRGKDSAIRTAFGVARPGEEVIVVVPPATTTATTSTSWWQEVLSWF